MIVRCVLLLLLLPSLLISFNVPDSPCDSIDAAFYSIVNIEDETPACRCLHDASSTVTGDVWIGCTGHSMPSVFDSLRILNETLLTKLHIWDSLINIIPSDMFSKLRPRSLIIERSGLALLRESAFASIGVRLKHLNLRDNLLKKIDPSTFTDVPKLRSLDLSGNRLKSVEKADLAALTELEELHLDNNDIESIEDGTFLATPNLRLLSMQGNRISSITNATFKGLSSLQRLDLSRNEIRSIDWAAFKDMKQLRVLDLGTNRISALELRGLINLQKLLLNNNSILSLKSISLRDLPALSVVSFDRNSITSIGENDLFGLSTSTRLHTLSLAANNISQIGTRAFAPVASLSSLSLQKNELKSLSTEGHPFLSSLKRLRNLMLSANSIGLVKEGEVPMNVEVLALDHNNLHTVDARALFGLSPSHIFLNHNHLHHLPRGVFDTFTNDTLQAFDISSNDWLCLCGEEWLGDWLEVHAHKDVSMPRRNGCLSTKACSIHNPQEDEKNSSWVTGVAAILAAVSLVILIAVAWLFIDDTPTRALPPHKEHKARGINADRLRLINDRERVEEFPSKTLLPSLPSNSRKVRFNDH